MLTILLWLSALLWALFFAQTLINWLLVPDLSRVTSGAPDSWPFVSIVVPARNEERDIGAAVRSFCEQDYERFEVVVVDDLSTDRTPAILRDLSIENAHLTVVAGTDPPEGWLGKPNALEIGRRAAKGEWLLFVDADVVYAPDLLRQAMAYALYQKVGMVALWPRYTTGGVLEAAAMSTAHLVLFACFPMFLVARSRYNLFATGSGVFNLVHRDGLRACGAFESLRGAVFDDFGLGFLVKRAGHKLAVVVGGPLVRIRMYRGIRDLVRGFTKNIYHLAGRWSPLLLPGPFLLGTVVSLLPYFGLIGAPARSALIASISALVLMHAVMACLVIRFRHPWYVIFLNPVREVCWWWILVRSCVMYYRKGIVWRDRVYDRLRRDRVA